VDTGKSIGSGQRTHDQSEEPVVLAFDVGGTRVKAGVVQGSNVSSLLIEPLDEREGAEGVLSSIVRIGRQLIAEHTVTAVGISIKGRDHW